MQEPSHEKQDTIFLSKEVLIAEILKWAIRQNPYAGQLPRKTEAVVERLNALLPDGLLAVEHIRSYVNSLIDQVPEIGEWNLSEVEYRNGVKVDDEERATFVFVSRFGGPSPEHDFIDLDALKGNVAYSLRKEFEEG